MSDINRLPNDQMNLNDLPDPLRRAVEHIRSQPAPQENLQRALDRACAMKLRPRQRWFHLKPEIQVRIAVAAAVLVAVAVGLSANLFEHKSLSRFGSNRSDQFAFADVQPADREVFQAVGKRTMDEIGNDPEVPRNYNSPRLEDSSIPDPENIAGRVKERLSGGILSPQSPAPQAREMGTMMSKMRPGTEGGPGATQKPSPNATSADGSMHNSRYGIDPDVFKALGNGDVGVAGLDGGSSGGGWSFRPSPLQRAELGPLNNGSLQPGFVFGFQPTPNGRFQPGGAGGFGGGLSGGGFGGGGFGGLEASKLPPYMFPLPSIGTLLGRANGSMGIAAEEYFDADPRVMAAIRPRIEETHTGSLLFGVGANSDTGLTGSIALAEEKEAEKGKKLAAKWATMSATDRQKAFDDIIRELPPGYKGPVTAYFSNLDKKSKSDKQPQVWHRDQQRPTFARVYLGGGNSLDLVSLQVSVNVEGPRARTVVDHIFHNPHDRQLEGTFEYPLPTGASVSYFGMAQGQNRANAEGRMRNAESKETSKHRIPHSELRNPAAPLPAEAPVRLNPSEMAHQVSSADWGALQEARVVGKQKALETYEDIVRTRIDPALLEYSGGNTFTGRVFPIPAKGYNRVIIAYEELLPVVNEHALYRFPLPNRKLSEVQFTLQANQSDFTEAVFLPKEAKKETGGGRVVYSHTWHDAEAKGEVVFAGLPARTQIQAISSRQGDSGSSYLYARVRPQLKTETTRPFADHAVFLLDTSLSEHPDRFAVSMKLWQQVLQLDPGIKKFNILAFNVGTSWIEPHGWLDNTAEGRGKALARLDGIVLEGATDLSAALNRLTTGAAEPGSLLTPLAGLAKQQPLEVFLLSDGQITWGNRDTNSLVANFESKCPYSARFHCYRIGLSAENIELFQALTRKGGGIYPCYSEAYLPHAARAHRSHCLLVERVSFKGGPEITDVLVAGRQAAVYPGGDLVVAARANLTPQPPSLKGKGELGRTKLVVEGTFLGERVVYEYPIEIGATSELAGRGWGELAVSSLLALNDPKLDSLVTAYCQQFGIGSRVASFLVLENPNDYKRLNLEEERGKVVPGGDLEKYLDDAWRSLARVIKPKQAFEQLLQYVGARLNPTGLSSEDHVRKLLALLTETDFELPETVAIDGLIHKKDVSPTYLSARQADPLNVQSYLEEAKRRANSKDAAGAVRVLSSVVEAYPTRADALRLVGYRLLDMQQPAHSARLFQQVEENRPFEPHSYRDLARSLEESGRYGFAALQYEIVLAGNWHNRFRDSLKEVAREEYAHMMQEALAEYRNAEIGRRNAEERRSKTDSGTATTALSGFRTPNSAFRISKGLAEYFGERLEGMASVRQQADLRVTISWNTDNTDVDLWVLEPDGTKCFYQNQKTSSGGQLSQDQTQGYGPERYQVEKALPGVYTIIVHYYRADANLLAGETHVNVLVTKHAGTPDETVERHTVLLKQANEQVEVCKVKVQ